LFSDRGCSLLSRRSRRSVACRGRLIRLIQ
jgi:hypothetical protein